MLKLCQFFGSAKGCKYGENCNFSHSNPQSIPICKSFLLQKCRYADKCKFSHTHMPNMQSQHKKENNEKPRASKSTQSNKNKKICRLYQQNRCRYGDKCKFGHCKSSQHVENNQMDHIDQTHDRKGSKQIKHTQHQKICRLYEQNRCRYGNKCKFIHSHSNKTYNRNIELKNLGICLQYIGTVNTPHSIHSNTLYYYYNDTTSSTTKYVSFIRSTNDQTTQYKTDIPIQQSDHLSAYCCGLIQANYLFVQQNENIFKCIQSNAILINNKLVCKYQTMDQITLKDYANNIQLISDDYDMNVVYYTIHDICICNNNRNYFMLFTLYVSTTNLLKITDIQIFDVSKNKMEYVYHTNNYNELSVDYIGKKVSLGQFYWFNKRALFYEEYNSKTGLGQFCVGWDCIDLYKSNRNILQSYLNGIDSLVDVIFEFVSTFNFIDKKRIIFKNIRNIQIDQSNAILYVSYFKKSATKKQMRKEIMQCYQIVYK